MILYLSLKIFVENKMESMATTMFSFLRLAKSQEVFEQHVFFSIELAGYIGKIHLHVFYYSQNLYKGYVLMLCSLPGYHFFPTLFQNIIFFNTYLYFDWTYL